MGIKRVNLVFTGMFLFIERKDCVEVLIPDMGTEHLYQFGTYLEPPQTIQPSSELGKRGLHQTYTFKKLPRQKGSFPTDKWMLKGYHPVGSCREMAYARFVLPTPEQVIPGALTSEVPMSDDSGTNIFHKVNFPATLVLSYSDLEVDSLILCPLDVKFDPIILLPFGSVLTILIRAEDSKDPTGDPHPIRAFEQTTALVDGLTGAIRVKEKAKIKIRMDDRSIEALLSLGIRPAEMLNSSQIRHLAKKHRNIAKISENTIFKILKGEMDMTSFPPYCCFSYGSGL